MLLNSRTFLKSVFLDCCCCCLYGWWWCWCRYTYVQYVPGRRRR